MGRRMIRSCAEASSHLCSATSPLLPRDGHGGGAFPGGTGQLLSLPGPGCMVLSTTHVQGLQGTLGVGLSQGEAARLAAPGTQSQGKHGASGQGQRGCVDWSMAALWAVKVKLVAVAADFRRAGAARPSRRPALETGCSFYWTRNSGSRWGRGQEWVGGHQPDFLEAPHCHLIGWLSGLQSLFSLEAGAGGPSSPAVLGTG